MKKNYYNKQKRGGFALPTINGAMWNMNVSCSFNIMTFYNILSFLKLSVIGDKFCAL